MKKLTRSIFIAFVVAVGAFALAPAQAADAEKPAVTIFTNVKVFNGSDDKLIDADVLVEGNLIKQVGKNLKADGATVIDGDGRTLMPGLIESHTHLVGGCLYR